MKKSLMKKFTFCAVKITNLIFFNKKGNSMDVLNISGLSTEPCGMSQLISDQLL